MTNGKLVLGPFGVDYARAFLMKKNLHSPRGHSKSLQLSGAASVWSADRPPEIPTTVMCIREASGRRLMMLDACWSRSNGASL